MKHDHKKENENSKRKQQLKQSKEHFETDGMNNLNYKLSMIVEFKDYMHIFADLEPTDFCYIIFCYMMFKVLYICVSFWLLSYELCY